VPGGSRFVLTVTLPPDSVNGPAVFAATDPRIVLFHY